METVHPKKLHLDKETDTKLDKLASRFGTSRSDIVRRAVNTMFQREPLAVATKTKKEKV